MSSPLIWGGNGSQLLQPGGINLTNGQVLKYNGNKNYLTNPSAETGTTTGWSLGTVTLTSALPTGTPTFGSGASGNLALTATSTTPLDGTYSFSYASSAATTAGNFIASNAYTIESADLGKVINFSFSYKPTSNPGNANWSGTSSNSFAVAIYDVTAGGANWIIPVGVFNLIQSANTGICTGSFQSSVVSGQQYRIVVYNANATSGAITVYFDNFVVGPQSSGFVSAISDWAQNNTGFVPSAGFGTVTGASYFYRRVGDSAEVTMTWVSGTVSGTTASVALPFTIDSTKLPSNAAGTWLGEGSRDFSGATRGMWSNNDAYSIFYDGSTTGSVFITTSTGSGTYTKAAGNGIASTGDPISIRFTVPVSGWSSGFSITGASTGYGQVVASKLNTLSTTSLTANTAITFTTTEFDLTGSLSSANKFTCPVSGIYLMTAFIDTLNSSGAGLYVAKNGSFAQTTANKFAAVNLNGPGAGAVLVQCNAGDTLQLAASASVTSSGTSAFVDFALWQGPSAANSPNASVNARYYASATSISGSLATIVWTTKDFDTSSGMSSGVYTIPVTGKYQVNSAVATTGTFALNNQVVIEIQKNSSVVSREKNYAGGIVTDLSAQIGDIISCIAGDTIRIQLSSGATTPTIVSSNFENYFSISLVGQ